MNRRLPSVPPRTSPQQATFLVVGLGGLGCPVATALAASDVGRIVLCDHDLVDDSNLQRQTLFRESDIGTSKVEAARAALARRGYDRVDVLQTRFDHETAGRLLPGISVVIEGTDDLELKFLLNDLCVARELPIVIGGVVARRGLVVPVRPPHGACYRCLFEAPPSALDATCAEAGVLGALCGRVAATMVASALLLADLPLDSEKCTVFEGQDQRPMFLRPRSGCTAHPPAALPSQEKESSNAQGSYPYPSA